MPPTTKPLSVSRAADRDRMAKESISLATECGATAELLPGFHEREVRVDIRAAGGLCVTLSFDGKYAKKGTTQPDTYILHWHMDMESEKKLCNGRFGGNVNPYHKQKATHICAGFDHLCEQLRRCLMLAASGDAFLKEV